MSTKTSIIRDVVLSIFDIIVTLVSIFKKNPADKPKDDNDNNISDCDNGHCVTRD